MIAESDFQYLLYPNYQTFKAADYTDKIVAAIEIEKMKSGSEEQTITGYTANI